MSFLKPNHGSVGTPSLVCVPLLPATNWCGRDQSSRNATYYRSPMPPENSPTQPMPPEGRTARLILRPLALDDADQIQVRIGSQSDTAFLQQVLDEFGTPDIVLGGALDQIRDVARPKPWSLANRRTCAQWRLSSPLDPDLHHRLFSASRNLAPTIAASGSSPHPSAPAPRRRRAQRPGDFWFNV